MIETIEQYYTPAIEEFHIGFEYERCDSGYEYFKDIFPRAIDLNLFYKDPERFISYFRVKHLTVEDVESLGWKCHANTDWLINYAVKKLSDNEALWLHRIDGNHNFKIETILTSNATIHSKPYGRYNETLYQGEIKNKSEFIRLIKQLGIR